MANIHPLKRWLFEHEETTDAFSKRTKIARSAVFEWLRWRKRPSLDIIDRVTEATNGEITANHFPRFPSDQSTPPKDN
jgi:hypothetical protein